MGTKNTPRVIKTRSATTQPSTRTSSSTDDSPTSSQHTITESGTEFSSPIEDKQSDLQTTAGPPERRMSPEWEDLDMSGGYLERNAPGDDYEYLLKILNDWKSKPSEASRVAAFIELGKDILPLPLYDNHLAYHRDKDTPLPITFFGEVAPDNCRTALGARGKHYSGGPRSRITITDKVKVFNSITLRPPTEAPPELEELYMDQVSFLNLVYENDRDMSLAKGEEPYFVKEVVSNDPKDFSSDVGKCINFRFEQPRYVLATETKETRNQPKKRYIKGKVTNEPQTPELTENSTHAPTLQPDYGGNIFTHENSRLRQLPVYDTDKKLVETWNLWKRLRPGTLITLNAELICWVYETDKRKKVFQLKTNYVKIYGESPEEAVQPTIRYYPDIDGNGFGNGMASPTPTTSNLKGKARAANNDNLLSSIEMSPSKKSRRN